MNFTTYFTDEEREQCERRRQNSGEAFKEDIKESISELAPDDQSNQEHSHCIGEVKFKEELDAALAEALAPKKDASKKMTVPTDEDIYAKLEAAFSLITNLEEYGYLIDVIEEFKNRINLRFLTIMFDAMVPMEKRVWSNFGFEIPLPDIYKSKKHLLLDSYKQFVFDYNKAITDYAKTNGIFKQAGGSEFLYCRTQIYSDFVVLAGEIIDPDIMSPICSPAASSGSDT
ncbi:MAG: hypothetical protein RSC43_00385 [Clostridia bacterium]